MSKKILIKNGRVLDPSQKLDGVADVLIEDGKIEAIAPELAKQFENKSSKEVAVYDVSDHLVTPGWVDMHTHLREPGQTHKETIYTGSLSAAHGGFTSIACMANTHPVNDNSFITNYIHQKAAEESVVHVYCIGAISKGLKGEELSEIGSMAEAGIVGLSDDGKTVMNSYLLRKAMDYSKQFNLPIISHAEDTFLKGKGVMNEGFHSAKFGLRGIPKAAEEIIVARDIILAEHTGAKLHIAHVSTKGSVELLRQAKKRGLISITAEVTPHHLTLTDDVVGTYDTNTKVAPPLREQEDVDALIEALQDGTIDALASDHAPHALFEKEVEYDLAEFGMVGLETAFPLYHQLNLDKKVSLNRLIEAMTCRPASILGIRAGSLKKGQPADLTVVDLNHKYTILKEKLKSKSHNTPFHGRHVQGKVVLTFCRGELIYDGLEDA